MQCRSRGFISLRRREEEQEGEMGGGGSLVWRSFFTVSQTLLLTQHFLLCSQSKHSHSGDLCFNVNTAFVSIRGRLDITLFQVLMQGATHVFGG